MQAVATTVQGQSEVLTTEAAVELTEQQPVPFEQRAQNTYDSYILGPGDWVQIELLDLPELSGIFTIGPHGSIYLPRLRALKVEGLTVEELRLLLNEQFSRYVHKPEVFITPVGYRPTRVYVGGEVARPGYYTIRGAELVQDLTVRNQEKRFGDRPLEVSQFNLSMSAGDRPTQLSEQLPAPTLFDALQAARGVTPFSQLDTVRVTRKRPLSQGGGKIQANVNFLRFISDGDDEVNIRLFDGDTIYVRKSDDVLRDQLLTSSRTNLSPDFIEVFVSGRVKEPGSQRLRQGASLNQAIASAGGPELLRGRVEFLRFTQEGATDRRIFAFNPKARSGDYKNPVLMTGDVVRINESLVTASLEVINEITAPVVRIYSIYSLYNNIFEDIQ